jgi:hypothetical protein
MRLRNRKVASKRRKECLHERRSGAGQTDDKNWIAVFHFRSVDDGTLKQKSSNGQDANFLRAEPGRLHEIGILWIRPATGP